MTPKQIRHLRELEAKATARNWEPKIEWEPLDYGAGQNHLTGIKSVVSGVTIAEFLDDYGTDWPADAKLIVEARNALHELLDDWERMRAHLTNLIDNFWPACPSNHDYDEQFTCAFCGCRMYGSSQGHEDGCEWVAAVQYAESNGLLDPPDQPMK